MQHVCGDIGQCGMVLQLQGLRVTRTLVPQLLKEIDPRGLSLRKAHRLKRRTYRNMGPNYAWQCDWYDKLKRKLSWVKRKLSWIERKLSCDTYGPPYFRASLNISFCHVINEALLLAPFFAQPKHTKRNDAQAAYDSWKLLSNRNTQSGMTRRLLMFLGNCSATGTIPRGRSTRTTLRHGGWYFSRETLQLYLRQWRFCQIKCSSKTVLAIGMQKIRGRS